jgi:LysR family glycine cleavage system transcriptional activator
LFVRGTRRVELSAAGASLRQAVVPMLESLDRTVRDIRSRRARPQVNLSTFASFATLWLLPRLAEFQKSQPPFDIRISAQDRLNELDDPDLDLLLRYCKPADAPPIAERLFGDMLTPVASPRLLEQARDGQAPPLARPTDLAAHVLLEEDDPRPGAAYRLSWRRWLTEQGMATLQPRGWLYLNFTHQQVQGALAGQGVALARLALVHDLLERGELVELFDGRCRIDTDASFYMIVMPLAARRSELTECAAWIRAAAARTRLAIGEQVTAANGA